MESKKINRKFNSLFWCIIYSMPLVTFLLMYIGYLLSYHQTGNMADSNLLSLTLSNINQVFDKFIWNDLFDVLKQLFSKLSFDVTSDISKFIVITFTWFVQGMFLHIFIDTLTLIPKMYHKLMERWL